MWHQKHKLLFFYGTPNIASWNGNSWSAVGTGINATVNAFAVMGNDLIVGGIFTQVSNVIRTSEIASWNGSSWSSLRNGTWGGVSALLVDGNDLYLAGSFTMVDGVYNVNRTAKYSCLPIVPTTAAPNSNTNGVGKNAISAFFVLSIVLLVSLLL